ncbi:MAG TPA: hypothetical protein VIM61_09070 [Chthoniobacterales bacterium]|jgi:hypothetical protein
MLQPWMNPADLAPGDAKCATRDWTGFELHRIRSVADPHFRTAYDALWQEFGAAGEMEQVDVLERRLKWDPHQPVNGCALLYELLLVTHGGQFVAVRDHTAIVRPGFPLAVVHLSHNLVASEWRRCGIAGWLRALPAGTARACAEAAGIPSNGPIVLVAEMEFADPTNEPRTIRLTAYERAGYRKIAPDALPYLQPDFRSPAEIDASGGPRPVPLSLLVRFVGNEARESIATDEVRGIVESLYRMYAVEFRAADMAPLFANLDRLGKGAAPIPLILPTT